MRIHKNDELEFRSYEPEPNRNIKLEIGECISAPDGHPALEVIIHSNNGTKQILYLMKGRGESFKLCNLSGMSSYAETNPIGEDILKSLYFSMLSELILKAVSAFHVEEVEFYRGYSSNAPIERFLSSCINRDEHL